jgi:site-specific recombinase XerD
MNGLKHFVLWLDAPIETVTYRKITEYIDCLLSQRLRPKTINCYLNTVCQFYHYLGEEKGIQIVNPVKKPNIMKLPRGLPKHLKEEQIEILFKNLKGRRDQAMFMIMLRCGLRVEEVAHLSLANIDLKRRTLLIQDGKGAKDRIVYISNDALHALLDYLKVRPANKVKKVFLVEKGPLLHPRHPETDGILCPQNKPENLLSSSSPYNGHTDVECRHRSLHHTGPLGT